MAFIGIFLFMVIAIIVCCILIAGLLTGIIFSIVFTIRHKRTHTRITQVFRIAGYVLLGFNGGILLFGFVGGTITVLRNNSTVPSYFVDCEAVTMTENGFTSSEGSYTKTEYFAVGGNSDPADAVYSYKPSGKFKRSQWRNFYSLSTESGITVVTFEDDSKRDAVYVKDSDMDAFRSFYDSTVTWYMDSDTYGNPEVPSDLCSYFDSLNPKEMKDTEPDTGYDYVLYYKMYMTKGTSTLEFFTDQAVCLSYDGSTVYVHKDPENVNSLLPDDPVRLMDEAYANELILWYNALEETK